MAVSAAVRALRSIVSAAANSLRTAVPRAVSAAANSLRTALPRAVSAAANSPRMAASAAFTWPRVVASVAAVPAARLVILSPVASMPLFATSAPLTVVVSVAALPSVELPSTMRLPPVPAGAVTVAPMDGSSARRAVGAVVKTNASRSASVPKAGVIGAPAELRRKYRCVPGTGRPTRVGPV